MNTSSGRADVTAMNPGSRPLLRLSSSTIRRLPSFWGSGGRFQLTRPSTI
ncbi:MAG TPA: hypothetical protein VN408_30690 [Actinoplanes sp.]|nr:hypothetical protein [Actinoplanes sp.]